jgi:hypothetical protein
MAPGRPDRRAAQGEALKRSAQACWAGAWRANRKRRRPSPHGRVLCVHRGPRFIICMGASSNTFAKFYTCNPLTTSPRGHLPSDLGRSAPLKSNPVTALLHKNAMCHSISTASARSLLSWGGASLAGVAPAAAAAAAAAASFARRTFTRLAFEAHGEPEDVLQLHQDSDSGVQLGPGDVRLELVAVRGVRQKRRRRHLTHTTALGAVPASPCNPASAAS